MFGESIRRAGAHFGSRVLLREESGRELTYAEFDRASNAAAQRLLADGIGEGSVVALTLRSGIDYLVTYGAAAKVGAVTAGINPSLTDNERVALLTQLGADLVVDAPLDALDLEPTDRLEIPALSEEPDRLVAIVFTSGTTGTPKGAMFRNRQLAAIARSDFGAGWNTTWGDGGHMFVSTQFAHVGFMTKLPWYLHAGLTLHTLDSWRADKVLRLIDTYRMTSLGVVAPQLAIMLRSPLVDLLDLSCVQTIIAGGAASSPSLITNAIDVFGATYSVRYSSTESGGVGLVCDVRSDETMVPDSLGVPRPGVEVRVIDAAGRALAADTPGELCLRTPTAFCGYWRNDEATASTLIDGWIHTGDLAEITADGHVRLTGRLKEMYIRGGYNVAPAEVEHALCTHPLVHDIAIGVRPDPVMGEIGVAVVCGDRDRLTLDALRDYGAARLAKWKLPEDLLFVDQLPLTAMQKVDRAALNALVSATPPTD